ncbi:MAG: hypothetical protein ABEI96_08435 [Haloarculaceae archaeon]
MTDNHALNTPEKGAKDWDVPLNENFEMLDTAVPVTDTETNRTEYTPKDGATFLATDTGTMYAGDGSAWTEIPGTGRQPQIDGQTEQARDGGSVTRELLAAVESDDDATVTDLSEYYRVTVDVYRPDSYSAPLRYYLNENPSGTRDLVRGSEIRGYLSLVFQAPPTTDEPLVIATAVNGFNDATPQTPILRQDDELESITLRDLRGTAVFRGEKVTFA